MDYVFFHHCFIVLFQFLDKNFTLKVKKNVKSGLSPRPPPPHCGLSPSKCFFFFLTSLLTTILFLPMPLAVVWVNRCTFSSSPPPPPSPPSHFQLFVSLRYRKHHGGMGVYAILFKFLSMGLITHGVCAQLCI